MSIPFYAVFLAFQAVIFLYYLTKKMVVNEVGIEIKILGKITISKYQWDEMVEASINSNTVSSGGGLSGGFEATSLVYWIARKSIGPIIKIIINERNAFAIRMKEIKKSGELYDLLKQKIRFIP